MILPYRPRVCGFDFIFKPLPCLTFSLPPSLSLSLDLYLAPSPTGSAQNFHALKINLCFQKETGAGQPLYHEVVRGAFFYKLYVALQEETGQLSFRVNERAYHSCDITYNLNVLGKNG